MSWLKILKLVQQAKKINKILNKKNLKINFIPYFMKTTVFFNKNLNKVLFIKIIKKQKIDALLKQNHQKNWKN